MVVCGGVPAVKMFLKGRYVNGEWEIEGGENGGGEAEMEEADG